MASLGFSCVFVLGRLTWLLQPLDTHVFALYKRHLQRVTSLQRAESLENGQPTILQWLGHIRNTIETVLNGQSWVHAFRRNGFGAEQNMVSTFIRRHLLEASVVVAPTLLPTVTDVKHISPATGSIYRRGLLSLGVMLLCLTLRLMHLCLWAQIRFHHLLAQVLFTK